MEPKRKTKLIMKVTRLVVIRGIWEGQGELEVGGHWDRSPVMSKFQGCTAGGL